MCQGKDNPYVKRPDPPPDKQPPAPRRERWSPWIAPFLRLVRLA
jgi:hypothetical protein